MSGHKGADYRGSTSNKDQGILQLHFNGLRYFDSVTGLYIIQATYTTPLLPHFLIKTLAVNHLTPKI